jgi:hypothetical protein
MRVVRIAALTVALAAALTPASLPQFGSNQNSADSAVRIPLVSALSYPSVPAMPMQAFETLEAMRLSLDRHFASAGAQRTADTPRTTDARYLASKAVAIADSAIAAAQAESNRYGNSVTAREVVLDSRRFVGSSLLLLALLAFGAFAIRRYGRGNRGLGGVLFVGVVALVPLAISRMTNGRVSVPAFSIVNRLQTRPQEIAPFELPQLPKASDGEVWSHASLEEARPVAAKFVAELMASSEHSHWQMVDDDAVAKRQLTFSLALAVAAALLVLVVGPLQRLRRRQPPIPESFGPDNTLRLL